MNNFLDFFRQIHQKHLKILAYLLDFLEFYLQRSIAYLFLFLFSSHKNHFMQ